MQSLLEVISNFNSDAGGFDDFTAYLSKNHCLETLQFIQDASRYQAYYAEIVEDKEIPWAYLIRHYDYLQDLWEDLLGTYILPSGHREINLPSEVRARLLGLPSSALPPHPSELDDAVKIVLELMEDSILPGFLKPYVSLDEPGDSGGGWKGIFGRLQRKIPTPVSERGYEDSGSRTSGSREDGEATLCERRRFIGSAPRINSQPSTAAPGRVVRPYCPRS
ncbi:RGS domain-containing protein [Mariannaea sp. PMI_226]|nr:RGS domain-containing protein [Mariannaea sp. PMI_226]